MINFQEEKVIKFILKEMIMNLITIIDINYRINIVRDKDLVIKMGVEILLLNIKRNNEN